MATVPPPKSVPAYAGPRFTIDIDTGGTFTDCYVTSDSQVVITKADTTPHDLSLGVLTGIQQAAELLGLTRRALLERSEVVRLSTTIGTNTFINRSGAKVGLLIGERLARQVDRLSRSLPLQSDLIAAIPETIDDSTARSVRSATHDLLDRGARILVIALDGDADLPRRESAVRNVIAEDYPRHYLGAVPVLPSHQVTPVADGVIRIQTAVLDAYIHPVMSRFLYRVEDQLRADGLAYPLQVGNASGATSRVAKTAALRTWGSGPAGGVAGAAEMAQHFGLRHVVAVDIGGTSADICVITEERWDREVSPSIEGVVVALPTLRLYSAGIGCGSIVRVVGKDVVVGPDSAGAQPGPAAFGLGGDLVTVTDAACCLGYFDPGHFLGGRRRLDLAAARRVLADKIAKPLALSVEQAASLVLERTAERLAAAIRGQLDGRGVDASSYTLFATGGGAGILGHAVGRLGGFASVYAFPISPVFSAFGLSRLDISHSYEQMPAVEACEHALAAMRAAALADMRGEGFDVDTVNLQIEGEFLAGNEIVVEALGADFGQASRKAREKYQSLRLLRLSATVPGRHASLARPFATPRGDAVGSRLVRWGAGATETPVFDWLALREGTLVSGPAVLETSETTLLIPPNARGTIGALGEVRLAVDGVSAPHRSVPGARIDSGAEVAS